MSLILSGSDGLSDVDGSASTPAIRGTDANTGIFFPAADTIAFAEGGVEAMRLDSSGNVGIGTSTFVGGVRFTVVGGGIQLSGGTTAQEGVRIQRASGVCSFTGINNDNNAYNALSFATGASEAMRITSGGDLTVGATGVVWDERLSAQRSTNAVVGGFYSTSSSYTSSVIRCQTETAAGTGWYLFEGRAAGGGFQYGIRGNGTVATSDERRKKNIETARDGYVQDLCKLRVVKYNWKTDEDNAPKELGLIAQEVEQVFPGLVVIHHDGPNDDQEVKLLKKDVFVPMLIKAVQELKAELDATKARIAVLEAK